jgi:ribose transport system substrate-binding protein
MPWCALGGAEFEGLLFAKDSLMLVRSFVRFTPILPLTLAVFGCGSSDSEDATEKAADTAIELAFIPKTNTNLVFSMGNDGARFAAREITHEGKHQVEVEYLASDKLDPKAEIDLIEQAIADKKDGLLVSCVDGTVSDTIDDAVKAGIPVITYDSDCPESNRLGFYSMKSEETGAKSADLLASAMGSGAKTVAILTGRAGADNLERRVDGFMERLSEQYPDVSVVATVHCEETAESCGAAVEDELVAAYPDLDGLFVVGLWGLLEACTCSDSGLQCSCEDTQMPNWKTAAKGKLKTVAYDSLPFELILMQQGYVSAVVGQKYFGWGYETVSLMVDHLTKKSKVSEFIDSGFDVVCPNNVDQMLSKWDAADFREEVSPACDL